MKLRKTSTQNLSYLLRSVRNNVFGSNVRARCKNKPNESLRTEMVHATFLYSDVGPWVQHLTN